ncbi:MAG: exodeoxyribonuclease III [Halobacteriovoraceae bacterium]|jgi:exodeoxyribonuclease-3|nr:exodeoxyribonuclease III [Halobacteriovoraceae bacterium]
MIKKNERKKLKRLVSWNVNGIRACVNKGFLEWIENYSPDILCLQEIKALEEQFPPEVMELEKYHKYICPAQKKGYSGVAIFTKEKPLKVHYGLGIERFDNEGRSLILEYQDFVLFNGYFPNGQRDHARVPYKLDYYQEVLELFHHYRKKKKNIILTGDFNTAHKEIDLANPKSNKKTTGFLPHEREWIDKYLEAGMIDCLRLFKPNTPDIYSWWTYRSNCRQRNIGWRIDYFMVNQQMESQLKSCSHLTEVMGSDHCPIELVLKN